ncbi:hypothetical protein [Nannocystis pusilla]|uniref:hypothetical protein n=1 Tax=Nannocystis pusilla TaxID=889268 RepID=UPI003B7DEF22
MQHRHPRRPRATSAAAISPSRRSCPSSQIASGVPSGSSPVPSTSSRADPIAVDHPRSRSHGSA